MTKVLSALALIIAAIAVIPAMAQQPAATEEIASELFGVGQGLAAATVIGGHPVRVERLKASTVGNSATEKRYFSANGLRVVVFKFPQADSFTVASVEVTTTGALRAINHDWPGMDRAAIIANFGAPATETASSAQYKSAGVCESLVDIGLKDDKIASVKWSFCTD